MKRQVFLCSAAASVLVLGMVVLPRIAARAQQERSGKPAKPGPMLDSGFLDLQTPEFKLKLVRSSQTVAALRPKTADGFDFTPGDLLIDRSSDGYYHLGDLDLRLRTGASGDWRNYSTAQKRAPVRALATSGNILASADLSPSLAPEFPLQITRTWAIEQGKLTLRYFLQNKSREAIQIGGLGIPMVFNNVLTNRTLEQAHAQCSFYDPYIGKDAGYLQVTRLNGQGPALLVIPEGKTPFEAYNPIRDAPASGDLSVFRDPTPRSVTFEGFYDWMVHSQAFAETEWKNAHQWNPPTALTLEPGASKTYGLKFVLSDSIRHIEDTLANNRRPVAVGIPGYILPMGIQGHLFLKYQEPVKSILVEPEGALVVQQGRSPSQNWKAFSIEGKSWGRARITITYRNDLVQTIQYFVTKREAEAVADLGRFLTTRQWFTDAQDHFQRSPSVMSYDRDTNQIVTQDSRVWIAGLSDEGGAGSWLATILKQWGAPERAELQKFSEFLNSVLWGRLQYKDGPQKFGVRKSLFYYQPDELPAAFYNSSFDWKTWTSWDKQASAVVNRSFNYPHVAAAYWVPYRLARNSNELVTDHPWQWYLTQSYETSLAMVNLAPQYAVFGQMEGDIFLEILADLKREGLNTEAQNLESKMRDRANRWKAEAYPFGSEMPWDSTGQEEVYAWMKYFDYRDKADVTLNAILAYDPAIPHWGYNGSARRYWDFVFAGKYRRIERQLHHYGSSLNAIPLLTEFREHPDDFYLLRVGYAGTMGALTDIDQNGFGAAAFHAFPDMLKPDALSGDYGPNFFGHAFNTATYVVDHPEFGWVAFGGNLRQIRDVIEVIPLDSFRMRVYVAPAGLWLTLDSGKFEKIEIVSARNTVRIGLAPATQYAQKARLRVEQPHRLSSSPTYRPKTDFAVERDAYVVPLGSEITWVELSRR